MVYFGVVVLLYGVWCEGVYGGFFFCECGGGEVVGLYFGGCLVCCDGVE